MSLSQDQETAPDTKPRVLVLHESRIMRASITRYLKQAYTCVEADDFETGWQVLIDDPGIRAALVDVGLPREEGVQFVRRVAGSGIERLAATPMIVIVGGEGAQGNSLEDARARALDAGAIDFISKTTTGVETLARVNAAIALANAKSRPAPVAAQVPPMTSTQLFALCQHARLELASVCIAIDGLDEIEARAGVTLAPAIMRGLERALASELQAQDVFIPAGPRHFVVLAPARNIEAVAAWASVLQARVAGVVMRYQGAFIQVSASIGAASLLADAPGDVTQLIEMAQLRADAAQAAGRAQYLGATAVAPIEAPPVAGPLGVDAALALLHDKGMTAVKPQLPGLVIQLMPLMKLIEREYQSNFKLSKLKERASAGIGKD